MKLKCQKNSEYGKMVILGNKILNETSKYVGPQAKDPKKRFAGNNLSCSSCHANGGSVQNQSGFVGIWARFPQYNARGDKVITLKKVRQFIWINVPFVIKKMA
ncbi:hypothetical protein [Campylobacter jejuni]|uniref:hypothetical protein n=1 Tax=Campylobacter jejuni TaxID=197 RepID=UPI0020735C64|nr:hypothetical protein [Campylobacter jejuni]